MPMRKVLHLMFLFVVDEKAISTCGALNDVGPKDRTTVAPHPFFCLPDILGS